MRPKMAKMRLKMAKMRTKMAKMRFNMAEMRLKMAKMRPKKKAKKIGSSVATDLRPILLFDTPLMRNGCF